MGMRAGAFRGNVRTLRRPSGSATPIEGVQETRDKVFLDFKGTGGTLLLYFGIVTGFLSFVLCPLSFVYSYT
ncbi:MAG: hypothetical protein Fur0025_08990 [Oscillatoriaceae cyanobacterium]